MTLQEIIRETQATLRAHPDQAGAIFSVASRQVSGLRSEAKIRQLRGAAPLGACLNNRVFEETIQYSVAALLS